MEEKRNHLLSLWKNKQPIIQEIGSIQELNQLIHFSIDLSGGNEDFRFVDHLKSMRTELLNREITERQQRNFDTSITTLVQIAQGASKFPPYFKIASLAFAGLCLPYSIYIEAISPNQPQIVYPVSMAFMLLFWVLITGHRFYYLRKLPQRIEIMQDIEFVTHPYKQQLEALKQINSLRQNYLFDTYNIIKNINFTVKHPFYAIFITANHYKLMYDFNGVIQIRNDRLLRAQAQDKPDNLPKRKGTHLKKMLESFREKNQQLSYIQDLGKFVNYPIEIVENILINYLLPFDSLIFTIAFLVDLKYREQLPTLLSYIIAGGITFIAHVIFLVQHASSAPEKDKRRHSFFSYKSCLYAGHDHWSYILRKAFS